MDKDRESVLVRSDLRDLLGKHYAIIQVDSYFYGDSFYFFHHVTIKKKQNNARQCPSSTLIRPALIALLVRRAKLQIHTHCDVSGNPDCCILPVPLQTPKLFTTLLSQ